MMVGGLYVRTLFYGGCAGLTPNGVMVFRFTKKDNLPCSYLLMNQTLTDYCIEKQSTYNLENASSVTPGFWIVNCFSDVARRSYF